MDRKEAITGTTGAKAMSKVISSKFKGVEWAMQQINIKDKRIEELEAELAHETARASGFAELLNERREEIKELEAHLEYALDRVLGWVNRNRYWRERAEKAEAQLFAVLEIVTDYMNANDAGDYVIPVYNAILLCEQINKALEQKS